MSVLGTIIAIVIVAPGVAAFAILVWLSLWQAAINLVGQGNGDRAAGIGTAAGYLVLCLMILAAVVLVLMTVFANLIRFSA